ncbi:MAG: hypothetical protein E7208_03710 [Clostridium butyricum]|nr:hypothetical protein [Clostridium butyricum]
MNTHQEELLQEAYDYYKRTGDNTMQYTFDSNIDKSKILNIIDYLQEKNFIKDVGHAMGFVFFKLSAKGIDYCEGINEKSESITIHQAPNSINIIGSNNSISDNYNTIKIEIENANIPEEYKTLVNQFIDELKTTKPSNKDLKNKVGTFLSEILTKTSSSVAISILTPILTTFFSNIL